MAPETSVILPVRNGQRYVMQAVVSVLEQLDDGDELLIVDDGSTDDTALLLAEIADRRVRNLAGGGRGVSAARNCGLAAARGELIAFLDHDDLWPAGRHCGLAAVLRRDETLDAAYGRTRLRLEPEARIAAMEFGIEGTHACWLVGSALYRRRLLERCEGFAVDMQSGEDQDFYFRLTEAGMRSRLCAIDSLIYRCHSSNTTNDPALARQGQLEVLRRKLARARARPHSA